MKYITALFKFVFSCLLCGLLFFSLLLNTSDLAFSTNLGVSSSLVRSSLSYSGYEISLMGSYPVFSYKALSFAPALFSGLNQMFSENEFNSTRIYKQIDEHFVSLGIDTQIKLSSRFIFQTDFFLGRIYSDMSNRYTSSDLNIEASLSSISGRRYDISPALNYKILDTGVYLSLALNYSIHRYKINQDPQISGERLTNEGKFNITNSQKTGFKLQNNTTDLFRSRQNTLGTSFGVKIKL